jgi:hypothetical protein
MAKRIIRISEQDLKNILKSIIGSPSDANKTTDTQTTTNVEKLPTIQPKGVESMKDGKKTIVGKLNQDFYEKLLKRLSAPVTDENLKFLYAWRQSEGDGGRYNPFNTTLKKPGSSFFNYLNKKRTIGVQNYTSADQGLEATTQTLLHNRYRCIIDGLRKNIGASEIANHCRAELKVWGTGDLIAKVIAGYDKGASIKVKDIA